MGREIVAEVLQDRCLHAKDVADVIVSQRQRAVRHQRLGRDGGHVGRGRKGQQMSGGIQHRCLGDVDLDPAGCPIVQADRALNLNRIVDLRTMTVQGGGRRHALHVASAVANNDERSSGERSETDDPTADHDWGAGNVLAGQRRKFFGWRSQQSVLS